MNQTLSQSELISGKKIKISGSKSETNRLLLLQAVYPQIVIKNASYSDDSEVMRMALQKGTGEIDIHHAGTAMRFLTAFFASRSGGEVILTGSQRMKERPIHILVQALRDLEAEISYQEKEGYPPLYIKGKNLTANQVRISAEVSSQYISALMLIAPSLTNGLTIRLLGKITSAPYITMTRALLSEIGVSSDFEGDTITIQPLKSIQEKEIVVESDWSSASYWYSFVALSKIGMYLKLSSYKENSLQGDRVLTEIYSFFGVKTTFQNNEIILEKTKQPLADFYECDLQNAPDIAQTVIVTCFGLGVACKLTGLHTLKIKETDRLESMKTELEKLGATVAVTESVLQLEKRIDAMRSETAINTYNDHRMAMAFTPLMLKTSLVICDCEVVSKSYPGFWDDVFEITEPKSS